MPIISEPGDLCYRIKVYSEYGDLEHDILSVQLPLREEGFASYSYEKKLILRGEEIAGAINIFTLQISDRSGLLYSCVDKPQIRILDHPVVTDSFENYSATQPLHYFPNEGCSRFELMCHSDNYPGFTCKPIEPMVNTLSRVNQHLRR
jgi:hypothetical protein